METLGINIGYLALQVCIFILIPLIILGGVSLYFRTKGTSHDTETVMIIPVTDEGVVIPVQLLKGADEVAIKRKQDTLFLVPIKSKPVD